MTTDNVTTPFLRCTCSARSIAGAEVGPLQGSVSLAVTSTGVCPLAASWEFIRNAAATSLLVLSGAWGIPSDTGLNREPERREERER